MSFVVDSRVMPSVFAELVDYVFAFQTELTKYRLTVAAIPGQGFDWQTYNQMLTEEYDIWGKWAGTVDVTDPFFRWRWHRLPKNLLDTWVHPGDYGMAALPPLSQAKKRHWVNCPDVGRRRIRV